MKLFLDDERYPPSIGEWIIARSFTEACKLFETTSYNFVSLDHDLADELTGYDFAKWLVEKDLDSGGTFIPKDFKFYVHSQNPVGAANIQHLLDNYLSQR